MLRCRPLRDDEIDAVAAFTRAVYDADIAPHEGPEARAAYATYADAAAMRARAADHRLTVAEWDGRIVGALEVRRGTHVAMLFVANDQQRRGVGRALLAAAFGPPGTWPALTVNSTPGAIGAYARLGFVPDGDLQTRDGLRFQPMRRPVPDGASPPTSVA